MAGIKPSFITGASAKIKVGNKTFAYASDVSYQISVDTIPVETMGRYEAVTNEPVNYSAAGELSIVRYTKFASGTNANNPFQTSTSSGNGAAASGLEPFFNPASILASATLDLEIYQKQTTNVAAAGQPASIQPVLVGKMRDVRMNRLSGAISKRGILVERMSFVGILWDGDDFASGQSGDQDLA
jgi:hypothetical protein